MRSSAVRVLVTTLVPGVALFGLALPVPAQQSAPGGAQDSLLRGADISAPSAAEPFAVTDVRVFDGERVLARATVVVRDGRIAAVSSRRPARLPALVIDGRGRTLLPGLIDAHFHAKGRESALAEAVRFGVTTVLDMFSRPELDAGLREAARRSDRADYRTAGSGATVPGGHGALYEFPTPTITTPDSAEAFVASRVAEGSEYLKIVVEPGGRLRSLPTLDSATVGALVAAAHRRGLLAVAHVSRAADAAMVLRAGVDGLVHGWSDSGAMPAISALAARRGAFVVPTIVVGRRTLGIDAMALAADPRVRPWLSDSALRVLTDTSLLARMPDTLAARLRDEAVRVRANRLAGVRDLRRAGVRILAGADAGNAFAVAGASLHAELLALVESGLTPTAALAAATSAPAAAFRLTDRGRIAPGLRADLLLVEGDPTRDVTATRAIVAVWKGGVPVRRDTATAAVAPGR